MDIKNIIDIVNQLPDDVDKVLHISIAIEHLSELKEQIQFQEHPVRFKHELNNSVLNSIRQDLDNTIEELRNNIKFYLHYNNEYNIKQRKEVNNKISFSRK